MKEYKFRGLFDGEWKYGAYQKIGDIEQILIQEEDELTTVCTVGYIVKKGTAGQYIGLKDKNGVEIYKGDNLHIKTKKDIDGLDFLKWDRICTVIYVHNGFALIDKTTKELTNLLELSFIEGISEVIGNIHTK